MKRGTVSILVMTTLLVCFGFVGNASAQNTGAPAEGKENARPVKKGILLAAHGPLDQKAKAALQNFEGKVKEAFPDVPVRWAYTAKDLPSELVDADEIRTPDEALSEMIEEKFTDVAVQPLYPVLGDEYYHLLQVADAACSAKKVKEVVVGYPLFGAPHDIERIVETSLAGYPEKRNGNEAVVLMFPKTYHRFVEFYYPGVQYYYWRKDPNTFVGVVDGVPSLQDVVEQLKEKDIETVYLRSFAPDKVSKADDWSDALAKEGFKCIRAPVDIVEREAMAEILLDHLKMAFSLL